MITIQTRSCNNPILNPVLILLLTASVTSRTVLISIPPCFGISSTVHTSELHPMHEGTAYTLKTPLEGIPLNSNLSSKSLFPQACNYAFTLPTHPQYHSLTTFIKRFELNTTRIDAFVNLVFIGGSKIISSVQITKFSTPIVNVYLDTKSWQRKETLIYMFLMHNLHSKAATLHLDITLTPTYLCFLNALQHIGSHVKLRNPGERTLPGLGEIFHYGWLLCTTPVKPQGLNYNISYRYMAFCIDYRLSCDGNVNCPARRMLFSSSLLSADESSADLVCYAPSINWFLIAIVIFSTCNVLILCLINYVRVLRRYSPQQYLRLRNRCLRYSFFCLPTPLRYRVSGFTQPSPRTGVNISSLKVPISPPTYSSVEEAEIYNQKSSKIRCGKRRTQSPIIPKSGNSLPPSYSDAEDEIEVIPNRVIQKMHTLNAVRPLHSRRIRRTISPLTKPLSSRYRRSRNDINLRVEFRALLRRMLNGRRDRLRNVQQNQVQQASDTNQEQLPPQTIEESSAPPPNYTEFLSGDFPRFPEIVLIDYIRPPPSDRVQTIYCGRHRRHIRRF
ncbi:unnamed protein product [Hymenolepis diminuta]|uniref:Envelope glycoprotein L n=1 Tax=Hymenolepis diminuta TaxID=6216 RepID=A0A0R3STQ7_HYMDI|nr:unnamed protein product [Hymenolepis diminuta]